MFKNHTEYPVGLPLEVTGDFLPYLPGGLGETLHCRRWTTRDRHQGSPFY